MKTKKFKLSLINIKTVKNRKIYVFPYFPADIIIEKFKLNFFMKLSNILLEPLQQRKTNFIKNVAVFFVLI